MAQELQSIDLLIARLSTEAFRRLDAMNTHAVWLFLAVLGCWSVPEGWLRVTAMLLSIALFWRSFQNDVSGVEPTSKALDSVESELRELPVDEVNMKARLYDIEEIRRRINSVESYKRGWPFIACWSFMGLSLVLSLGSLLPRGA